MKPIHLIIFSFILAGTLHGAEEKKIYSGFIVKEDTTLKKLLSVPEIASHYKTCQDKYKSDIEKIPECLWRELDPSQKEKVKKFYAQEEKSSNRSPASTPDTANTEASSLTNKNYNIANDYKNDPSVTALSNFFGKKLDEALNGSDQDKKDKKVTTVDHSKFIDLFKSELGKSIVNSFTSYCMETEKTCRAKGAQLCKIKKDDDERKQDIKENLESLKTATFSDEEGEGWKKCILDVSKVCYETPAATEKETSPAPETNDLYSKRKACIVMDFVKASRKNLIAADKQQEFYNGLTGGGLQWAESNMKAVDENKISSDKITQITSADLEKDFKKSNDDVLKEATECADSLDKDKCKKIIDTSTEKNSAAITDLGLREIAQEEVLTAKLEDSKNVEVYLKEEGYDKNEIKALISKDEDLAAIKAKIKARYASEKESIIREMSERIKKKTTANDGKVEKVDDNDKVEKIKKELSSRTTDMSNLIHFNNIVSSYLTISDDKNKTTSRNTASLNAEANSMSGEDGKKLKETIKNNKDLQGNEVNSTLDIKTINENFLNYKEPTEK